MKLWLLRPIAPNKAPWSPWYDKVFGFVICAETEAEARAATEEYTGDEDEGMNPWLDSTLSTCIELTADEPRGMVICDFKAA